MTECSCVERIISISNIIINILITAKFSALSTMTMRLAIFLVVLSVVIQHSYGSLYDLKKQGKYSQYYFTTGTGVGTNFGVGDRRGEAQMAESGGGVLGEGTASPLPTS